jgi:hypothetical protein
MRVERKVVGFELLGSFGVGALSSRMAPRIVFSASTFAGSPVSSLRSGIVAISGEFRSTADFGKGGNQVGIVEKGSG